MNLCYSVGHVRNRRSMENHIEISLTLSDAAEDAGFGSAVHHGMSRTGNGTCPFLLVWVRYVTSLNSHLQVDWNRFLILELQICLFLKLTFSWKIQFSTNLIQQFWHFLFMEYTHFSANFDEKILICLKLIIQFFLKYQEKKIVIDSVY